MVHFRLAEGVEKYLKVKNVIHYTVTVKNIIPLNGDTF